MLTFSQGIAAITFLWIIFTTMSYGGIRAIDKQYKTKYFLTNIYKLGKIKVLFSFYDKRKGEIAKFAFWLNIVAFFISINFAWTYIMLIVIQVNPWKIIVLIFLFLHLGIFVVAAGFNIYYDIKSSKKTK